MEEVIVNAPALGEAQISKFTDILQQYKQGKSNLENKIIMNEEFWKLRYWKDRNEDKAATAWLWNAIQSKHADMSDAYPEPSVLPKESSDEEEARMLSEIIPVILNENDFRSVYNKVNWYKLKQGTGIYGIFWDKNKHNGLGDVAIRKLDAINMFWQPGITDIQDSRYVFHTELVDIDILKGAYPQLENCNLADDGYTAKYLYDDQVDTSDKATVIDVYYKRNVNGKTVLHYCKYTGNQVLYATENETVAPTATTIDEVNGISYTVPIGQSIAETGLYNHGKYPFVFDTLYEIEGSIFGYGMTDINRSSQVNIDEINAAIVKNVKESARRRYIIGNGIDVNLEEFADWNKEIIRATGNIDDSNFREFGCNTLPGICVDVLNNQVEMLKETSGNRDVNNGGTTSGVTAASAIAALQEQGNKGSRDILSTTYEAYKDIIYFVVELIRQFYDVPRQFRITGADGSFRFVSYQNSGIKPQNQSVDFGIDMGYRVPEFDIDVKCAKQTSYSKMAQNELMLQFNQLGFFNPQMATQAIMCLEGMQFEGKEDLVQRISENATLQQVAMQFYQTLVGMATRYDPTILPAVQQLALQCGLITQNAIIQPQGSTDILETDANGNVSGNEHPFVEKARRQAQDVSPN